MLQRGAKIRLIWFRMVSLGHWSVFSLEVGLEHHLELLCDVLNISLGQETHGGALLLPMLIQGLNITSWVIFGLLDTFEHMGLPELINDLPWVFQEGNDVVNIAGSISQWFLSLAFLMQRSGSILEGLKPILLIFSEQWE